MALNLTPQELQNLQRLQHLQRLHWDRQLQQAAAPHQPQANCPAAHGTQPRRRHRHAAPKRDPAQRMLDEVGPANRRNRRAFKAWSRRYKQDLRARLAQDWASMLGEVQRYGVSRPERFVVESSGNELRDFIQGLEDAQKLALFGLAMMRQEERGDITSEKVAVFNTVNGRPGDMPLGTA